MISFHRRCVSVLLISDGNQGTKNNPLIILGKYVFYRDVDGKYYSGQLVRSMENAMLVDRKTPTEEYPAANTVDYFDVSYTRGYDGFTSSNDAPDTPLGFTDDGATVWRIMRLAQAPTRKNETTTTYDLEIVLGLYQAVYVTDGVERSRTEMGRITWTNTYLKRNNSFQRRGSATYSGLVPNMSVANESSYAVGGSNISGVRNSMTNGSSSSEVYYPSWNTSSSVRPVILTSYQGYPANVAITANPVMESGVASDSADNLTFRFGNTVWNYRYGSGSESQNRPSARASQGNRMRLLGRPLAQGEAGVISEYRNPF